MLSIGLYGKQFAFFLALAAAAAGGLWYVDSQQASEAAPARAALPSTSVASLTLRVQDGGRVQIGEQTVSGLVEFESDREIVSYQAFQEDGTFVERLTTTVSLPRAVAPSDVTARHFGSYGVDTPEPVVTSGSSIVFQASNLTPQSSYRVEVVVPKGTVRPALLTQVITWFRTLDETVWLLAALGLPLLASLGLGAMFLLAHQSWRGPRVTDERPTPPLDLAPAVVGVLLTGKVSPRSLAATLLDLAKRGYLQVVHRSDGFSFGKRRALETLGTSESDGLTLFERTLLGKIFRRDSLRASEADIAFRIGHHIFSRKVAEVYVAIYQATVTSGWFVENPQALYQRYRFFGLLVSVVAVGLFALALAVGPSPYFYTLGFLALFFVGVVMHEITPFLPRRTRAGDAAYREWLKFRNYLASAAPIKKADPSTTLGAGAQGLYERYLPYAVAFGCEVEWTERFMKLPFHVPDWYTSESDLYAIEDFANSLFPIVGTVATDLAKAREPFAV